MRKILKKDFFNRDTKIVARELIGKYLVRKINGKEIAAMIMETEAYDGFEDKASHAHKGMTPRTQIMFGHPGHFYVYLCYGMYYMLNISTREHGYPAAVLIRGIIGHDGPGKLTRFLKIDKKLNAKATEKSSGLWVENRGEKPQKIKTAPRIGINYAGPVWTVKKWRFVIKS